MDVLSTLVRTGLFAIEKKNVLEYKRVCYDLEAPKFSCASPSTGFGRAKTLIQVARLAYR